jgi:hypothetical protein
MNEFYCNIDATRKNYLIISPVRGGRVHIVTDAKTDDELAEVAGYGDCNALSSLAVGASCVSVDGDFVAVRIA